MNIAKACEIVRNYANQYNDGDVLEALHDMSTIFEYLTFEEATAYRVFMDAGREMFAPVV